MTVEGVPGKIPGMYSTVSYGCCLPVHHGKTSRCAIRLIRPATAVSRPGSGRGCSNRSLLNWVRVFTNAGASIFEKPLSMAVSAPQKKGSFCRPYKAWQGHQWHGNRRRFRSSCRHYIQSASPHEVKRVETTIENRFVSKLPERIIGDKAYDSDPLDQRLRQQ